MDEQIVVTKKEDAEESRYIRVVDLLNADLFWLATNYPQDMLSRISAFQKAIMTYAFPKVDVTDVPIDVATEIFTRINVTGKPLNLFAIMVAKTYDEERNFDLSEKFDAMIQKLIPFGYGEISSSKLASLV